jgi:PHD/YefM family antitoxin component YafN of YafNO toxin-antitoxin module
VPEPPSDIESQSNLKQDPAEFLRQLRATKYPLVITLNGQAELVVKDAPGYQKLLELAEREDEMEDLRLSIEDMRAGRVVPWEEVRAELIEIVRGTNAKTVR